jgi:myo-inositol-1(or 4)-monophosphatase
MMNQTDDNVDADLLLAIAEGAARAAGALIRRDFQLPRDVRDKGLNDLVTGTDVASENLIISMIRAAFPTHRIATEESGVHAGAQTDSLTWWVDPLDGTSNFVHGVPRFSVSIACANAEGTVLAGVVYDPMFEELFMAARGRGATCNSQLIKVSSAPDLQHSLVASGFVADLRKTNNNRAEWSAFVERCQGMARMGSCALDLCYVASGRFEVYWEYGPTAIDRAAGALILLEAGGHLSDVEGRPYHIVDSPSTLASNGLVHEEALAVLTQARSTVHDC